MNDGVEARMINTGIQYSSERQRPALLEQARQGEHVWVLLSAHVISLDVLKSALAGELVPMDAENLAMTMLGCYLCEEPYTDRLTYRRCEGEPL